LPLGVIEEIIFSPELLGLAEGRELFDATEGILRTKTRHNWLRMLTDTVTPQGIVAVARIPESVFTPEDYRRVLLLDRVQDPGNVGTLLRAACAFGFSAVLAMPGTADFYSSKVLRASAGYGLRLQLFRATRDHLEMLGAADYSFFWGAPQGGEALRTVTWPTRVALWGGNESKGVAPQWGHTGCGVNIESCSGVDSLNVAVATSIIMCEIYKSRGEEKHE